MEYRRFGNKIVARIDRGEEILEKIKEIGISENIRLAHILYLIHILSFFIHLFF